MDMFDALAEPTRRNILELLAQSGQLTASEIYARFSATPSAISQHLKILREAKLVQVSKQAQHRVYQIENKTLSEVGAWITKINNSNTQSTD